MTEAIARVMVATPTYTGDVCHQYVQSYIPMWGHCLMNKIQVEFRCEANFSLVQYVRNFLTYQFLSDPAFTHLFWIDADLGFEPTALARMLKRKVDVIGGVYTDKRPTNAGYPYVPIGPVLGGLQEASYIPGGFMLLTRAAVQKVADACPTHIMEHGGKEYEVPHCFSLLLDAEVKRLRGEDFGYCDLLRKAGFKIYVETDVSFVHLGRREWPANLAQTLAHEAKAQALDPKR